MKDRKSISGGRTYFHRPNRSLAFSQPEHEKRDRRNHAGRRGNGKAGKVLAPAPAASALGRDAVEPGQAQRAASQINKRDHPAEVAEFPQDDPINHQGRRKAEGNNVGERIELAAKRTFMTAEPRQSPIEQIENAGAENEPDGGVKKIAAAASGWTSCAPS